MKILIVHNAYQRLGGEDAVVAAEARLLKEQAHTVVWYERHNDELRDRGALGTIAEGIGTVWAGGAFREVKSIIAKERPDVAHFHNTFPLISPAAYYACAEAGVPVVQTLHNYRLLCPGANLLREGRVCEECVGRSLAWPGLLHACYRGSRAATAAVTAMLAVHRAMKTWQEKVDVYIALSEFSRWKFIEGGLPAERIVVKPNFVHPDPGLKSGRGEYALYVGRLSEEKGLRVLLAGWDQLREQVPLRIVGDGPLKEEIAEEIKTKRMQEVELLGRLTPAEIIPLMHGARFLVLPSVCFENFPLAIVEAFACGLSVIASGLGSLAEIVHDQVTGLHFNPGSAEDLADKIEWAWTHPTAMQEMGHAARAEYENKYTAEENYRQTIQIYTAAIGRANSRMKHSNLACAASQGQD